MASKSLRSNQSKAVTDIVNYFRGTRPPIPLPKGGTYTVPAQRCVVGFGGTGCGKTLIAGASALELKEKRVLAIVPPCGGVVFAQWMEELGVLGAGDRSMLYAGDKRIQKLEAWRSECDADHEGGKVYFVVSSIATLYADASNLLKAKFPGRTSKKKKYHESEWSWAYRTAAEALGKFDLVIIDEFQEFRNGSPPNDEKKAIDPTKSYYAMLNAICSRSHPLVLGLSATPIVNSSGEIYSLMRLALPEGAHEEGCKLAIMEKTRSNPDPSVKRRFKEESRRIRSHIIVAIEAPVVPPTTYETVNHVYTAEEATMLFSKYGELSEVALEFLKALISFLEAPENGFRRMMRDMWKNRFLAKLTHCKRLTIAPECFEIERERADPKVDPATDAAGNVIMVKDADGQETPLGRLLPFDVQAAYEAVPLEHISKFSALVEDLRKARGQRSMVISEYSDVIELLELYLRDAFPGRQIFKFHGGISGRDRQLAAFKAGDEDAILLATRGSMGVAINVECVTVVDGVPQACVQYQLDLPMSQSAQQQTEGRIKRPIAQPGVQKWTIKKVLASSDTRTLEDWLEAVMAVKNNRCSDMLVDRDEEATEGRQTHTDTDDGVDGPLKMLIEMLAGYAPPKEEKKRKREQKLLDKAKKAKA
jgi:hypothetical protein